MAGYGEASASALLLLKRGACGADDTTGGTGTVTGASMDIDSGDDSPAVARAAATPDGAHLAEAASGGGACAAGGDGDGASGGDGSGGVGSGSGRGATHSNTGMVNVVGGGGSTKSPLEEALVRSPLTSPCCGVLVLLSKCPRRM